MRTAVSLVFLFFACATSAQTPPTTFRATTRLVQVSVVVHDKDGRPVTGLEGGDFTLYENGKEQPIELFSIESDRVTGTAPVSSAPTNDFSNRVEGRASGAVTVILFDRLNTRFEDQTQARYQVVKFLGQIQRDDHVALYVLESNVVRVLHDFTSDATSLLRALSRYRG
jgi:VWFA-related protein